MTKDEQKERIEALEREVAALTTERDELKRLDDITMTGLAKFEYKFREQVLRAETAEAQRDELQKRIGYTAVPSGKPCESPPPADPECICIGNWRKIVKEVEPLIGKRYVDNKGHKFTFYGVVHGEDDYYYGMWRNGDCHLLSCVGSIEGHGYSLLATGTAQATECETNGTEGLRAELDAAKRALAEKDAQRLPALPMQKALTVVIMRDDGAEQADAFLAKLEEGGAFVVTKSEMFFHQLRLRATEKPELLEKIDVFFLTPEREYQRVGLRFEDELRWPVSFMQEQFETEAKISGIREKERLAALVAKSTEHGGL